MGKQHREQEYKRTAKTPVAFKNCNNRASYLTFTMYLPCSFFHSSTNVMLVMFGRVVIFILNEFINHVTNAVRV